MSKILKILKILRIYDLFLSILILIIFSPIIFIIFFICFIETGSPFFIQLRVGRNKKSFKLLKFRTMRIDTPSLASHLINKKAVTRFGSFMRIVKLDELPQLINVIRGEMSLVGPRPCLLNQEDLIKERIKRNIFSVKPGITGLAQIEGIDMSDPIKLSVIDKKMIDSLNQINYLKYLISTLLGKGIGDKVKNFN
tara:strand:- start:4606 stop:5190 length:585 start_codon:yes stop_codon:yes gene_type:complete